jgi:hypothetical protein
MLKNAFHAIKSIFGTPQKRLNIFKNSLKQNGGKDHIYHFLKPERAIIEMWQRRGQWAQLYQSAYITRARSG